MQRFSSKVKYHAVIRYLYLKGETGKEIHGKLANVYESSYAQVEFWVGEFKRGRTSLEDEARSGHPLDATNKEMCKKVRDLVPYKFYVLGQISLSKQCRPRSDCF